VKQPVPQLGDDSVSFEDVNNFYSFWYGTDVFVFGKIDPCFAVFSFSLQKNITIIIICVTVAVIIINITQEL